MELCEELVRREVGICCIQEVRWRGMGSKSVGSSGRKLKLWWSGNEDKIGGVGILWVVRSVEKSILRRAEKRMLRMMCGVQLADGVSTKELIGVGLYDR